MENCDFVIVISSFQAFSALPPPPPPSPTNIIVAVLYSSLVLPAPVRQFNIGLLVIFILSFKDQSTRPLKLPVCENSKFKDISVNAQH